MWRDHAEFGKPWSIFMVLFLVQGEALKIYFLNIYLAGGGAEGEKSPAQLHDSTLGWISQSWDLDLSWNQEPTSQPTGPPRHPTLKELIREVTWHTLCFINFTLTAVWRMETKVRRRKMSEETIGITREQCGLRKKR